MMVPNNFMRTGIACLFIALLFFPVGILGSQDKEKKVIPAGKPLLWQEPVDIATRNLYWGPGGERLQPDLSKLTLIEEKESSGSIKYRVKDGSDREWIVKIGGEVRSETATSRIVWAAGYYTDATYLMPRIEIEGKGSFENAKFEARPKGIKRLDEWLWDNNPFVGTQELQGLKLLLVLIDNWDIKNENNEMLFVKSAENELRYIVSDFDTKYDRTGKSPSLWYPVNDASKLEQALRTKLVASVKDGLLVLDYSGRHKERLCDISLEQVRWLTKYISRLSDQQIQEACRAGNYTAAEAQAITKMLRARITELTSLK
jgi:hypothetical protein